MNKKNRKKLLASATMVVASIALLVGLTFAWFTDSVKSSDNKIQAGTLGITASYQDVDPDGSGYQIDGVNGGAHLVSKPKRRLSTMVERPKSSTKSCGNLASRAPSLLP